MEGVVARERGERQGKRRIEGRDLVEPTGRHEERVVARGAGHGAGGAVRGERVPAAAVGPYKLCIQCTLRLKAPGFNPGT